MKSRGGDLRELFIACLQFEGERGLRLFKNIEVIQQHFSHKYKYDFLSCGGVRPLLLSNLMSILITNTDLLMNPSQSAFR